MKIDRGIAKAEVQEDAAAARPERRRENAGAERPAEVKLPAHQRMPSLVGGFVLSVGKHVVKWRTE